MTDEEFRIRVEELMAIESTHPLQWIYMSFAEPGKFLGGCIVQAQGPVSARASLPSLGIKSPGGEVLFMCVPEDALPPETDRNRLLTEADIYRIWPDSKTKGEWDKELDG